MDLLIGTYTKNHSQGIYAWNNQTFSLVHKAQNPTYLAKLADGWVSLDKDGILVYKEKKYSFVSCPSQDHGSCHIAVNPQGDKIVTSNYHDDCLDLYCLTKGQWVFDRRIITPSHSHNHQANFIGHTLLVCQLGLDLLARYDLQGNLIHSVPCPKGVGLRHVVVMDPWIYGICEFSGQVLVFDSGGLKATYETGLSGGAAIKISPDGNFLYASFRKENKLAIYKIVGDGFLNLVDVIDCGGDHPRDFLVLNQDLVVANLLSNHLAFFDRHPKTGLLTLKQKVSVYEPTCLLSL